MTVCELQIVACNLHHDVRCLKSTKFWQKADLEDKFALHARLYTAISPPPADNTVFHASAIDPWLCCGTCRRGSRLSLDRRLPTPATPSIQQAIVAFKTAPMLASLRSLHVQLQLWPAALCPQHSAEVAIPAARRIAAWVGTAKAATAAPSEPACAEVNGAATDLYIKPHRAQHCANLLPPSGLSVRSATGSNALVTGIAQQYGSPNARGQWRSHAGWSTTALPGVSSSAPSQHLPAASNTTSPCFRSMPRSRTALPPARGSQHTASSRGAATDAGPQLLDSAGRPIASERLSTDLERLADDADERRDAQRQAAGPQQGAAAASASGDHHQPVVTIDRSGLRSLPDHEHGGQQHKGPETALLRHLKALIRVRTGCAVRRCVCRTLATHRHLSGPCIASCTAPCVYAQHAHCLTCLA